MGTKKYTRKQLRQPDEFITKASRVAEYVKDHAKLVLVSLVVAAVIIAGVWTVNWYRESTAKKATAALNRATEMYTQMVMPGAKTKLKPREDGIPRFETREAKLQATEKELDKVIKTYGGNPVGTLALAMRGAVHYDAGKFDKAIKDFEKYLADSDSKRFRTTAIEGLVYCYEAQKKWAKALEYVKKLPAEGEGQFLMLYHEGRLLAGQGNKDEAAKRFDKVVKKSKSQILQRQAGQRLALLQAR